MYDTQKIAFKVKIMAKERNVTIKQLLENCQLNVNTISELSKGKQISYINFAKIADELGCSVDYLLSRTDNPAINGNNNINQSNVNSDNSTVNVNTSAIDKDTLELVNMIQNLSIVQKAEIILKINEMKNT